MNSEDKDMIYRGIVTGSALTKNTPPEVISLNSPDDEMTYVANEPDEE